ncbi:uncharacterized protein LOC119112910 [Pollicipes pollicipes]|uniref:uncharacterized protein LOC119112910 n=1 Tax=Pollicipes pollicipes TaxID=41117 RepID=UPI001884BE7E|nr:uncharacterized protein LOC119112910 [Pollicipes pollicipes]
MDGGQTSEYDRYVCLWRAARRLEQAIQEDDSSTVATIIATYAQKLMVQQTKSRSNDSVPEEDTCWLPSVLQHPLQLAVEACAHSVVRLLLSRGFDPNTGQLRPGTGAEWASQDEEAPPPAVRFNLAGRERADSAERCPLAKEPHPRALALLQQNSSFLRDLVVRISPRALFAEAADESRRASGEDAESVAELVGYGADVNVTDEYGNTPLHVCVCRAQPDEDCLYELVEMGASVYRANNSGVCPAQLYAPLAGLQAHVVECLLGLMRRLHCRGISRLFAREKGRDEAAAGAAASRSSAETSPRSARGSVRSRTGSVRGQRDDGDPAAKTEGETAGHRSHQLLQHLRQFSSVDGAAPEEDPVRCLDSLAVISRNPEVLYHVLGHLRSELTPILDWLEHVTDKKTHRKFSKFLHTVMKTAIWHFSLPMHRRELARTLSQLISMTAEMVQGSQDLQFTALTLMNRVVDETVARAAAAVVAEAESRRDSPVPTRPPESRRGLWHQHLLDASAGAERTRRCMDEREPHITDALCNVPARTLVNVLHNAITLHKRIVMGKKQRCTPSVRVQECQPHCLQILSSRLLLFLSHLSSYRVSLVEETQLRLLVSSLDTTHDPQLLCLSLQLMANLALDPANHDALLATELVDSLIQLILPSDEWYYTNHSTMFARFVKHHAARVMVYIGLQNRINQRTSVFDLLQSTSDGASRRVSLTHLRVTGTEAAPAVAAHRHRRLIGM